MATGADHSSAVIEVERKFTWSDDITTHLEQLGARQLTSQSFTDRYHDTPTHALTLSDLWLRTRDGVWELKSPPAQRLPSATITQYLETESPEDIARALLLVLAPLSAGRNPPGELLGLPSLLKEHDVGVFAEYRTERRRFELPGELHIVLDETDFEYKVGEVERLVAGHGEAGRALEEVDDLIRKMGVDSERRVPGKMEAYLAKSNPAHLKLLVDAHVISDIREDSEDTKRESDTSL